MFEVPARVVASLAAGHGRPLKFPDVVCVGEEALANNGPIPQGQSEADVVEIDGRLGLIATAASVLRYFSHTATTTKASSTA